MKQLQALKNKGALVLLTSGIIDNILGVVRMPIVTNYVIPEKMAIYAASAILLDFGVTFSDLGFGKSWMRTAKLKNENTEMSILYLSYSVIFLILTLIFAPTLSSLLGLSNEASLFFRLAATIIMINSSYVHASFILDYRKEFRFKGNTRIVSNLISFLFLLGLLELRMGVWSLMYATICRSLILSGSYLYRIRDEKYLNSFNLRGLEKHRKFATYQIFQRAINFGYKNIDYFFLGLFFGPAVLGSYFVAYNLSVKPIRLLNPVVNRIVFSELITKEEKKSVFIRWYKFLCLGVSMVYLLGFFILSELVPIFLGEGYKDLISYFVYLFPIAIIAGIRNYIGNISLSKGDSRASMLSVLFHLLIYAILLIAARPNELTDLLLILLFSEIIGAAVNWQLLLKRYVHQNFRLYYYTSIVLIPVIIHLIFLYYENSFIK